MKLLQSFRVKPWQVAVCVGFMLGAVTAGEYLKPNKNWTEVIGVPHYEVLVPKQFGNWVELPNGGRVVLNPVQEEALMKLYTETFARSYVNQKTGRVLMLSIAYGKDQSTDTQIHAPEACYRSQGFEVSTNEPHDIRSSYGTIKATRLSTAMGPGRNEPVTYFIRVGNQVARGSKERNLTRLQMAFRGYLVDGMLFRVSEVTRSPDAHQLQDQFVNELLTALGTNGRKYVIGELGT